MTVSAISKIYWRTIKRGTRTYDSIKDETVKDEVKYLAQQGVVSGEITEAEYLEWIGEEYVSETEAE